MTITTVAPLWCRVAVVTIGLAGIAVYMHMLGVVRAET